MSQLVAPGDRPLRADARRNREKVLEAATTEKRATIVSSSAKMNVLMSKFAPKVADRMGQKYFDKQQYEEPPRDPSGTLNKPGHSGRVYGSGGRREKV